MSGCVILLPIAVTLYITHWWFIRFFDGFFSPIYESLGIHVIGLGFVTSFVLIFLVGVFVSSWIGASVLSVGEWFIKRMPLVKHIYSASKQISAAISRGLLDSVLEPDRRRVTGEGGADSLAQTTRKQVNLVLSCQHCSSYCRSALVMKCNCATKVAVHMPIFLPINRWS